MPNPPQAGQTELGPAGTSGCCSLISRSSNGRGETWLPSWGTPTTAAPGGHQHGRHLTGPERHEPLRPVPVSSAVATAAGDPQPRSVVEVEHRLIPETDSCDHQPSTTPPAQDANATGQGRIRNGAGGLTTSPSRATAWYSPGATSGPGTAQPGTEPNPDHSTSLRTDWPGSNTGRSFVVSE